MGKLHSDNRGFGATGALLIILILAVVGLVGAYVWRQHKNITTTSTTSSNSTTKSSTTNTTPTTKALPVPPASSYPGWKSYTLTSEKLSFKYPSTWQVDPSSSSSADGDQTLLKGPNSVEATINTGTFDYSLPFGGLTVDYADPVTFVGQSGYLDFTEAGSAKTGKVWGVQLSKSTTDVTQFFASKNVPVDGSGKIDIEMNYPNTVNPETAGDFVYKPLATYQSDPNYKDFKLIVESITY